ncbi:Major Facilitator Superfamily [Popillia japonica]|uniref:Major Facilitator Superfamily n=1 Tax=Popillia japonica TaxID=7064 RepID=A0AAW1LWB3_POPJA
MAKCIEKTPENFENAVTKTGFGKFNLYVLLIGGGCVMAVIMETMGMMFIIPAAVCDLDLDLTSKGLLASISFLGVVSSSHIWGFLADTRGRRNVLLTSMMLGFLTSVLSSLAPNAWSFILIRYLNGFLIGGASAVVYAYVGEFHNNLNRPKVVSWIATFVALGNVMLPALSWIILPLDFKLDLHLGYEFKSWRLLVIAIGSPSLLFSIGLYYLPESPKCLLSLGKFDEGLQALKKMYACNTGNDTESFPVSAIIWEEERKVDEYKKSGILKSIIQQTVPLFKFPYLTKTFMVCLLQFGTFASSSGLFMWYPEILNNIEQYSSDVGICEALGNHNYSSQDEIRLESVTCADSIDNAVYESSLIIGGTLALLYMVIGSIITIVGGKNLLLLFFTVTSACGIAAQLTQGSLLIKILMGVFLMASSCVGIINTVVVELYPTHLRGMALAISLMAGRFGAVTGSYITGQLIYKLCDFTFYIFGLDHLILIITTILLPTSPLAKKLIEPMT